ncbi:hypothetical protein [Rhodococcus sp. NPDC003348]
MHTNTLLLILGAGVGVGVGDPGTGGSEGATGGTGSGTGDPAGTEGATGAGSDDDEPLGEGGKKALVAERNRANAAEQQIADLQRKLREHDDAKLTEDQRRQRDADERLTENGQLKERNGSLEQENQRLRAALDAELPKDWADRIRGATPEEMAADAKAIKAQLKGPNDGDHTPGVGASGGDSLGATSPGMGTLRAVPWKNN